MVDNQAVAQHFEPEERAFVSQATDWLQTVSNEYRLVLTHFLNPRERHILSILIGDRTDIKFESFGIFDRAEKERVVIAPEFIEIEQPDFEETLLQISFPKKFLELRHKDLLGAFLSAGIDRAVFGDILLDKEKGIAQVAVERRQEFFIEQEILQIGKVSANWQSVSFDQALIKEDEGEEEFLLVPSLRLDAVIASCFNLSRTQVKEMIESGFVAVNWSKSLKTNRTIHLHDVISVRKKGRISLQSLAGHSKSDKIKAVFQIIHR
ncbi:RNA-binding protein [Fructobacillus durionis]|uniref:RNA-binding protein YlmH, contains S4-like domain n=1 Tax=Fructobacillus durionis TaxID=283737 RepID=A0A1I1F6V5_9LACO|nr:YlmH/Sll1252 family protein [Fructobacillus durionis]SFB95219.1 RNA-binding protein YlmH, contains S4-like domain [Fructobacillus durionis]